MMYIPHSMFVVIFILQNIPDLILCCCFGDADIVALVVVVAADVDVVTVVVVVAATATVDVDDTVDVADVAASAFLDIHPSHHVRRCFDSLEYS